MGLPYTADKILFAILNKLAKSFQLKLSWSKTENAGDVGDYTTIDEALEKCQDSSPSSLRISMFANLIEEAAATPPAVDANEIVFWHDTTNDKYYLCLGVSGGMKSVELV